MPTVYLKDKNVEVDFPDNMTRDQMQEAIMQKFYGPVDPHIADLTPPAQAPLQSAENKPLIQSSGVIASAQPQEPIQPQNTMLQQGDSITLPFDESASIQPVTQPKDINNNVTLPFDESGFKPKQSATDLVKKGVANLAIGTETAAVDFNKMIGLGAFKPTKEAFIGGGEKAISNLNKVVHSDSWLGKQTNSLIQGMGALAVDIPKDIAVGSALKLASAGTALAKYLTDIPSFVLGSGATSAAKQYEKEPGFKGVPKAIESGMESAVVARLYTGDTGAVANKMKDGLAKSLSKDIGKFTAIGIGDTVYKKAREGKVPTKEELENSATQSVAMALVFSALPMLEKTADVTAQPLRDKKAFSDLNNKFDAAYKEQNIGQAVSALNDFMGDDNVSPKAKQEVFGVTKLVEGLKGVSETDFGIIKKLTTQKGEGQTHGADAKMQEGDATHPHTIYVKPELPLKVRYEIIPADELKTSHSINGEVNKEFPGQLQPRDRKRAASLMQINSISKRLNPDLLGSSPDAAHGAPIVSTDSNNVEVGHGRTLSIKKAYENGIKGEEYKQWLIDNAEKFGLSKKQIEGTPEPILVRRRLTDFNDKELRTYVEKANESDLAKLSETEQAKIDSGRLTQQDMSLFRPADDGNLLASTNKTFVKKFLSKMSQSEQAGYVTEDGIANRQLVDRIQSAIFHKAYNSSTLLTMAREEANPDLKNILNALQVSAKSFAKAQSLDPEIATDIGIKPIVEAIKLIKSAKQEYSNLKGTKDANATETQLNQFLSQQTMFESKRDPDSEQVATFIAHNIRSGKRIGEFFDYIGSKITEHLQDKNQMSLFGEKTPLNRSDTIDSAFTKMEGTQNERQKNLFNFTQNEQKTKTTLQTEDFQRSDTSSKQERNKRRALTGNANTKATTANASIGDFAKREGEAALDKGNESLPAIKGLSHSDIQLLGKEIMAGKHPSIREKIARHSDETQGIFYPKTGKVVLRADLFKNEEQATKTLSHELFHVIDHLDDKTLKRGNILGHIAALKKYLKHTLDGVGHKQEVMDELKAFTHLWKPFDAEANPKYTKYRYKPAELYADAGSALLTEPEYLKKHAPLFYHAFMDHVDARPSVKKAYSKVLEIANMTPEEQTANRVEREKQMFKEGSAKRLKAIENDKQAPVTVKDFLMTGLWDNAHAALKTIREGENKTGAVKENAENARKAIQELQHIGSITGVYLSDYKGGVLDALKKENLDINDLGVVGFNKRIAEGDREDKANPITNKSLAEQDLSILGKKIWGEEKFNKFESILKKFRKINEKNVHPLLEKSNLFPKELMDYIKKNTNYLKWDVSAYFDKELGTHGKGTAHIYKQYGTMSDIDNPVVATVMQNISLQRAALVNMTKQEVLKALSDAGKIKKADMEYRDSHWRPKEPSTKSGLGVLTIFEKSEPGKPHYYYVDKGVADLFKYAPEQGIHLYNLWSAASQVTKELIVGKNPAWMARNLFLRDISATATNIPGFKVRDLGKLAKAYYDTLPDVKDEAFNRKMSDRIKKMKLNRGLPQYRLWTSKPTDYENEIERQLVEFKLIPEADNAAKKVPKKIRDAWDTMEKLGFASDLWSKVAADKFLEDRDAPKVKKLDIGRKRLNKALDTLTKRQEKYEESLDGIKEKDLTSKQKQTRAMFLKKINLLKRKIEERDTAENKLTRERAQITRELAGTPDAKQHSRWHRLMDSFFLFSEMGKAGIRQGLTAYRKDKAGYAWRTTAFNILPKVVEHVALVNGSMVGVQLIHHMFKGSNDKELEKYATNLVKQRGKAYDLIPDWDKEHYQVVPLGVTDDGRAAYFRIPLNYEGQVFGMLGQLTAKEIMKQIQGKGADMPEAYKGFLEALKVENPYNMHPFLSGLHHIAEFLSANNIENWKGYKVIPQRVMNLGGVEYIKKATPYLLKQLWNDVGLGSLYDFQQADIRRSKKWYEKALNVYGLNAIGTYLKFSDRGEIEKIQREWDLMRQQKAKGTYKSHEIAVKIAEGGYKNHDKMIKALLTPGVTRQKIIKEMGLRSDNKYIRLLAKAHNNDERMIVIKHLIQSKKNNK